MEKRFDDISITDNQKAALNAANNPTTNNKFITQADLNAITLTAINVTYTQLLNLVNNFQLKPGNYYLLTDFQLTHTIPYTNVTWTSNTEQLLLLASSAYTLSAEGYSVTYPTDIIYYSLRNDTARMPGCTKGFIYRRYDTVQGNDLEIDFRNVRFRRWMMSIAPLTDVVGNQSYYWSSTDNGNSFQDFPMFDPLYYATFVKNNKWTGFDFRFSASIFGNINFVQLYNSPLYNTNIQNSQIVNVTLSSGGWFYGSTLLNSIMNNVLIVKTTVFTLLKLTMINSTLLNKQVFNREIDNTLISTTNSTPIDSKTFIYNRDAYTSFNLFTPEPVKNAITSAPSDSWLAGEFTGIQPAGSQPGMRFCSNQYKYSYENGNSDTDGSSFVWVRTLKSV